jgi:site-specific DNA-methyltransferase (adenine-specific)
MVATLKGDMQREGAVSGILVTLEEPTGPMRQEAADAGRWNSELHESRSFPVVQLITVSQLLAGEAPDLPRWGVATFRKAGASKRDEEHPELFE